MGGYEKKEPTIKKSFNKDLREIKIVQQILISIKIHPFNTEK